MATPVFACGAECGVLGSGSTAHFESATGTATISTSTVRNGSRSFRCTPSAAGGVTIAKTALASVARHVGRVYVRFATLPDADSWLASVNNVIGGNDAAGPCVRFKQSDSKIYAAVGTTLGASGVSVTTDTWYRIDFDFNIQTGGVNDTCDVRVDGTICGQATAAGLNANSSVLVFGVNGSGTRSADVFFDDIVLSNTAGDYPIGSGYVNHFVPTADGAHNVASSADFQRGNTAVDITNATTTAWQLVDDVPLPSGAVDEADDWRAVAPVNATDYVEAVFGPASGISTPTTAPRAVEVILAHHQIATTSGSMKVDLNDNGTVDSVLNIVGQAGVTTYRYARKHYAAGPAGAWTIGGGGAGDFTDLRCRFYSADANPDQCLDAIMVEAEFAAVDAVTIAPPAGALTVTGVAPSLAFVLGMTAGALSLTGETPTASVTIPIETQAGALTITSEAPTLRLDLVANPDTGQLSIAGQAVALATDIGLPAGALAFTGGAPTLAIDAPFFPAAGALALTGAAPSLLANLTLAPDAGALTLTGTAPVLDYGLSPGAGTLTLAGVAPELRQDLFVTPDAGALVLTGTSAALDFGLLVSAGALVLEGAAPFLDTGQGAITRAPDAGALVLTGAAPTVISGTLVTPGAGSLVLTGETPSLRLDLVTAPSAGALILASDAPTLAHTLPMTAGALTLAGAAPNLVSGALAAPDAGTLTLTGVAPSLRLDVLLTPDAGALTLTGAAPALFMGALMSPAAGSLVLTGAAPSLRFDLIVSPAAGALTLSGIAPSLSTAFSVAPTVGALVLTGAAPSLTVGTLLEPAAGSLVLTGAAPNLQLFLILEPAAGALTLTGAAPTVTTQVGTVIFEIPTGSLTFTGQTPAPYGILSVLLGTSDAKSREATITNRPRTATITTAAHRTAEVTNG